MQPRPEKKLPLDTPQKPALAAERRVFMATEKFCEIWGDYVRPGDLVEIVHRKVVVSEKPSVVRLDFALRKVSGVPAGKA